MSTPSGSRDYGRFDELAEEFAERYRRGERPSLQEYIDRFPEMADEIREMFPALVEVERAQGDARVETSATPAAVAHPGQIGDYQILREIGRGGMGVVYEAVQVSLGRRVALKVLPGHAVGDRKSLERFRREARSAARLHHTNIVPVYEVGREGDVSFYAMQLIQGQGLDQVIDELARLRQPGGHGPAAPEPQASEAPATAGLTPVTAAAHRRRRELNRVAESLLSGRLLIEGLGSPEGDADAAIEMGATERFDPGATSDPTPAAANGDRPPDAPAADASSSAVLPGGTHVSEVDSSTRRQPFFRSVAQIGRQAAQGLAYAHARGVVHRDIKPSNLLLDTAGVVWITDFGLAKAEDDGLTATGDILGTLRYMAPERFRGGGDVRADVYGLGLTLYELLTLRPAYDSSDRLKLIEQVKAREPARPRSLDGRIPRDLETIVLKAIEKEPGSRYPSAEAMGEDLRRFLADEPIRARQISTSERYWRWARRNPVIAAMGGVLTALLVAVTAASLAAASHFRDSAWREADLAGREKIANARSQRDRKDALQARNDALQARNDALQARREAIEERDRSRLLSAGLAFEKGMALGEEGRADHGLLWMLEALKTAPGDAAAFRRTVRWNLGAWLGQVHKPLRISEDIGYCTHLGFSPDGSTFATGFDPADRDRATPIVLWDTASGAKLKTLAGAFAPFAFRADGKALFACAEPDGVLAIELATERVLWRTTALPGASRFGIDPSPDGSAVLAHRSAKDPRRDWLIRLDAATGRPLGEPLELPGLAAVAPDGRTAAVIGAGDDPPRIALHEVPSGRRIVSWPYDSSYHPTDLSPWSSRFSPDGRSLYNTAVRGEGLLYQGGSRASRIWGTPRGEPISPIMAGTRHVTYAPAADRILTYTNNLWLLRRAPDGQPRGTGSPSGGGDGHASRTHPDGLTVITHATDNKLRLWQISPDAEPIAGGRPGDQPATAGPRLDRETPEPSLLVNGFLTDGRIAITNGRGVLGRERVRVSDLATGRPLGRPALHQHGWAVRGLALSPDGRSFATGSNPDGRTAGEVRLWDVGTGRLRFPPLLHTNYVPALAFRPDGEVLASGDYGGLVRLWDTSTGEEIGRPLSQGEIVLSLAYSPDGKVLAVGLSSDHTGKPGIRLWDAETRERIGGLLPSTEPVNRIEFRPDGRALLAVHSESTQLWDTVGGRAIGGRMLDETSGGFRPDGRAFLTLGRAGTVKLRDAMTGAVLARLMTAPSPAVCAAFRGDGGLVAVGFQDGSVRLCDPATPQPIGPPRFMEHGLDKVVFTPDGRSVAGIDIAGNTRVWPVPRPLPDEDPDDLRLRIEARTGLHMESDLTIGRLATPAWRDRLERLGRLDPSAVRRGEDPAWHEPMVREAEQGGNAFAAIWHLDRLMAAHPGDWFQLARRARAWSLSDQFEKADADYERAERLGSREQVLDFRAHRVVECTRAGRWAEALWYLDRLIAARPDDASLHEDRAAVYARLGREADRRAELARVFELGADEGLVIPRAEELGRIGRWAEAAALLARCGRKGPVSRELAQAWAVACLEAGDRAGYREACAAFLAGQGPDPTVVWNALSAASLVALAPGAIADDRVPLASIEKRLAATPAPTPLYRHLFSNALGGLLLRAGRPDEAISRVNDGIAAAKEFEVPTDWAYLALAHARQGRLDGARHWLERLRTWQADASVSFWDLQELALLRGEAESLLLDAGFPSDPFQRPGPR
jgi:serine/threonine protein kinase/WD40 repeat protein/tetratricopeptide (TPR) repeat protein